MERRELDSGAGLRPGPRLPTCQFVSSCGMASGVVTGRTRVSQIQVQSSAPPPICFVTLGKSCPLSEPWFPVWCGKRFARGLALSVLDWETGRVIPAGRWAPPRITRPSCVCPAPPSPCHHREVSWGLQVPSTPPQSCSQVTASRARAPGGLP